MRRILVAVAAASTLLLGSAVPVAATPAPAVPGPLPPGWSASGRALTWTSERPIRPGDAAVEFWSGERMLGRADSTDDLRTFVLTDSLPARPADLQVRIGGKRVDASAPARVQRRSTTAPATSPPQPAHGVDPGVKGPFATISGEYSLPGVTLSAYPQPVEMQAVVVAPRNAPGKRPLALFLHGRHWTCFTGDDPDAITLDWPCPAPSEAVPSHRGYLQSQELLASQGYVTVSISANGINAQDDADDDGGAQARSSLIRKHLALWADWSGAKRSKAPAVVRSAPRADLSKVFLMGHSRGGEGVNRAALDSLNPPPAAQDDYRGPVRWTIRGLFLIGPTIFGHNPQPDVPSATILPGCDGDVSDLQGQMYIDATRGVSSGRALHSALYAVGANHNYFNTEWTPGQAVGPAFDDFFGEDDPLCTPGAAPARLTAQQQQTAGATYLAAAARLFVGGDDRVRPLLDGSGVRAASAGPATVLSHALGGNRTPVIVPGPALTVGGARLCEQAAATPESACLWPESYAGSSPHFVPFTSPESGRYAVALNGTATATLKPAKPVSVAGARSLALRLVVPPNAPAGSFAVAVTDERGKRTELGTATVSGVPGTDMTTSYWGQEVRLTLPRGVRTVSRLDITPRGAGEAWLIDAWGWRPGTPVSRPSPLSRVDVGSLTVEEGDAGTATYSVPVSVRGRQPAAVRLFATDRRTGDVKSWVADIAPGATRIEVPITVTGNTTFGGDQRYPLAVKAVRNAVVGDYDGGVNVQEDDPMPKITLAPAAASEGSPLVWTARLSEAADDYLYLVLTPQAPAAGPELSSTDVDPVWFEENSFESPEPSRPLSETGLQPFLVIEPGTTSAELSIPTVTDGVTEGAEHVRFTTDIYPPDFGDPVSGPEAEGTVTD